MGWSGNSNKWTLSVHDIIAPANIKNIVAYFCHHLSDNDFDMRDLYVFLSDLYVYLSFIRFLGNKSKTRVLAHLMQYR